MSDLKAKGNFLGFYSTNKGTVNDKELSFINGHDNVKNFCLSLGLYFGELQKSLQMVIEAMKLEDTYSLDGML